MRLGPPRNPRRVADLINPAAALAPAANVIMQLASPGIGHGVPESPVDRVAFEEYWKRTLDELRIDEGVALEFFAPPE